MKEGESKSSPTISFEDIFTTPVVDAYKGRDVGKFYVPGVYLHAKITKDKHVLLKLKGDFVDIMCIVSPNHEKYVIIDKG